MKWKISQVSFLKLPKLKNPFELETNVSGYALGVVLMQGDKSLCYHCEMFHGGVMN
jgi:hypothetical protein